jgi:hypothetical protein
MNETASPSTLDEFRKARPEIVQHAACASRPTRREKKQEKPYRGDLGMFLLNVRDAG